MPPTRQQPPSQERAADPGIAEAQDEVQKTTDEAEDKGYIGVEVDPTDNAAYTVAGVTSDAPTPESDPEQARRVRAELDQR